MVIIGLSAAHSLSLETLGHRFENHIIQGKVHHHMRTGF